MHQTMAETKTKIETIRKGGERSNGGVGKEIDAKVNFKVLELFVHIITRIKKWSAPL